MKMRSAFGVLLLSFSVVGAAGCAGPDEVTLGAILSLEGAAALSGNSIWRGIQVAVDEVNAAGGVDVQEGGNPVPLRIEMRDAQSDPQIGLQHARELINMGLPAVIGSDSSDVTLAIADLFQQEQVILLSPSSSTPALSEKGSYIYRNFPSNELEAINTANYIYNVAGIHEVDIIGSQSEFGLGIQRSFIERFRALGGRVEQLETFPAEATDVSRQVGELSDTRAGGVYIAGYTLETARVAQALREAGVDLPLFGTGAIFPGELIRVAGDAVQGLVYPTVAFDPYGSEEEGVRRFVAAYRNKFGEDFDVYAAHGYDAVLILVQAIEQDGLRPNNISFYLNAMNPFLGAAGATTFDDRGNARKFHRMFKIEGARAVAIDQPGAEVQQ